jgi:uncharacterized membrane protein YbhN (UPF0104 family)
MDQSGWKRWLKRAVKAAVAVVVLWAVGRHVLRTWSDIRQHDVALQVQPGWLVTAGALYLAGLSCSGWFYGRVVQASATPIGMAPAIRAYLISHLGKYVPGKAMVVVMRAGLSVPYGARAATAAIATFYETLVMMAAGGLVAALGFAVAGPSPPVETSLPGWGKLALPIYHVAGLLSFALSLAFLVIVLPPLFRRLSLLFSMPFPKVGPEALPVLTSGLLARGLCWSTAAWILLGCSQLAVARALASTSHGPDSALLPVVTASVALATVAGFVVAVLPGGLGVREGVLMVALGPSLGQDEAVVAALALRLVWVAAEALAAAVLLPLGARSRRDLGSEAHASTSST